MPWKWKKEITKGGCRLKVNQINQIFRMVIEKFYELGQTVVTIHKGKFATKSAESPL